MKKFLALILCLSMLLCITPIIASAEGETAESTPTGTKITTLEGLRGITGNGDYYLANDIYIDLSSVELPLISSTFTGTLDGGNNSILFQNKTTDGTVDTNGANGETNKKVFTESKKGIIFDTCAVARISNLTVGSAQVPVEMYCSRTAGTNNGILGWEFKNLTGNQPVYENVTVYGNIYRDNNNSLNAGLFFAEGTNNVYFINCNAIGKIQINKAAANVGGFVGIVRNATGSRSMHFVGCISDVEFSSYNGVSVNSGSAIGGIVGKLNNDANNDYKYYAKAWSCFIVKDPTLLSYNCNKGVLCAVDGNNDAANTIKINESATPATLSDGLKLTTNRVASIRFAYPTGIRFQTTVTGLYDTLVRYYGNDNVKLGTIIAPYDYVNDAGIFTMEALNALEGVNNTNENGEKADNFLKSDFNGVWYGDRTVYSNNNGTGALIHKEYTYTGAIAQILEENYAVKFCGIGYISYRTSADAEWTTIYANYNEVAGQSGIPAFSIQYLANMAVNDENGGYTATQIAALQKYLPKTEG